jgi:hypothetical protein
MTRRRPWLEIPPWRHMTLRDRLLSRLELDPSGCVLWTGHKQVGGYGQIQHKGKALLVHRVMYELFTGPIPRGMTIDHLCRVRHCANVSHLEVVTLQENLSRRRPCAQG